MKKTKQTDGTMSKGALLRTGSRGYQKIREDYSLESAILEIAQNAFEHGDASTFTITYCYENGTPKLSFFNNGKPMTDEQFSNFARAYQFHDTTHSSPSAYSQIGSPVFVSHWGLASKDTPVFCAAENGITKVTYRNYYRGGRLTEWVWNICVEDSEKGSYDTNIKESHYNEATHSCGFEIEILNCREFTETDFKKAQKRIAKTFSTELIKDGEKSINVQWKDERLERLVMYDPMHFEQMPLEEGQTIYNCPTGEYISNDIIWFVDEKNFRGKNDVGDIVTIPVRTISAYINQPTYKAHHPFKECKDYIETHEAGYFPRLGNVYIETGGNKCSHIGGSDNAGGAPRYRVCPLITQENFFLWGVKSIKNNNITPFDANPYMTESFKEIEEDGSESDETLYDYLRERYAFLERFHDKKIRVKKGQEDYYKENGFVEEERVRRDIEDFKNNVKPSKEFSDENRVYIIPKNDKDILYVINKKSAIIKKIKSEGDTWIHSLNTAAANSGYNESSKEDILYAVFDTLEEIGVDPSVYQKLAETLSSNFRHYDD